MKTCVEPRRHAQSSALALYYRDINETPLLSADEERQLARRIHAGDGAARDRMVRANLRLVVSIARHHVGKGLDLQDLIEEGNLGLMRAVELFDPDMNTRFGTYAAYWIRQSIRKALMSMGRSIRFPAYVFQMLTAWQRVRGQLHEALGREPTPDEIHDRLRLSRRERRVLQQALRLSHALPHTGQAGAELHPVDTDLADPGDTPEEVVITDDVVHHVLGLLGDMEPRQAQVLRLRYGLGEDEPLSLARIGRRLGLTRERVRQIERQALGELRQRLRHDEGL